MMRLRNTVTATIASTGPGATPSRASPRSFPTNPMDRNVISPRQAVGHSAKGFEKTHKGRSNTVARNAHWPLRFPARYFWNGARIFSISAWAFFIPSSGVYFSSRISWKVVTKMFRIFQLSCVLISGKA